MIEFRNRKGIIARANKAVDHYGKRLGMTGRQINAGKGTVGKFFYELTLGVATAQVNNACYNIGDSIAEKRAEKRANKNVIAAAKAEAEAELIREKGHAKAEKVRRKSNKRK